MPCLVQALERGPEASSSSDEEQEEEEGASAAPSARKPKAYDTEQEQLRRSFLEAAKVRGDPRMLDGKALSWFQDGGNAGNAQHFLVCKVLCLSGSGFL
eukprot:1160860-Pelagomonas_calceolata.AAC.5